MLTETQKAQLVNNLQKTVDWKYPASGNDQYDFNPYASGTLQVYRKGEPVEKIYPSIQISFLPRMQGPIDGLAHVLKEYSGCLVFGYTELEPVVITVYAHQISEGAHNKYHGKLIADDYIRKIENYVRRYWPRLLQPMEAYIYEANHFDVQDLTEFLQGTEKQAFELTFYLVTTNKWDYLPDGETPSSGATFKDAVILNSGLETMETYISVSGHMIQ